MSTCNSHTHRKQNIPEISRNLKGFFDCMQRGYTEWRLLRKVEREKKKMLVCKLKKQMISRAKIKKGNR